MCERRISGSTWSTQIAKTGHSATAKCNMRRSESYSSKHAPDVRISWRMRPRFCLRIVNSEASAGFGHHGPFCRFIAESPPSCHDRKLPSMPYLHVPTTTCNAQSRLWAKRDSFENEVHS